MKFFLAVAASLLLYVLPLSAQSDGPTLFQRDNPARKIVYDLETERPFDERSIEYNLQQKYEKAKLKKQKNTYVAKMRDGRFYRFYLDEQNKEIMYRFDAPVTSMTKVLGAPIGQVFNDKYDNYGKNKGWHLHSAENRLLHPETKRYITYRDGYLEICQARSEAEFAELFERYKVDVTAAAPDESFKYGFNPSYTGEVRYYKEFFPDGEEKFVYHGKIVNGKKQGDGAKYIIERPRKKYFELDEAHPLLETGLIIDDAVFENDKLLPPDLVKFQYGARYITYQGKLDADYFPSGRGRIEIKPYDTYPNHFLIEGNFGNHPNLLKYWEHGHLLGENVMFYDVERKVSIMGDELYFEKFFRKDPRLYTRDGYVYFDDAPNIRYRGEIQMAPQENGVTEGCPQAVKSVMDRYEFPLVTLETKDPRTGEWKSSQRNFEFLSASGCVEITPQLLATRERNEQERIRKERYEAKIRREREEADAQALKLRREREYADFRANNPSLLFQTEGGIKPPAPRQDAEDPSGFAAYMNSLSSKPTITVKNSGNLPCQVQLDISNGSFAGGGRSMIINVGAFSSKEVLIGSTSRNAEVTFTPCSGGRISVRKNF